MVHLPADNTKGGATTGKDQHVYAGTERVRQALEARRSLGPDAYVFGKENGRFTASFDKPWKRLFLLAGLPVGRKTGFVWHDQRHVFCSKVVEQGATIQEAREMARHADIRTTAGYLTAREERLRELASKLDRTA